MVCITRLFGGLSMLVVKFERKVAACERLKENDRIWFPRWLRRYALAQRGRDNNLPVNRGTVVAFSRSLLESGAPAWQRWQSVRAVECYRDFVLEKTEPDLSHIVLTLTKLRKQERNIDLDALPTDEELAKTTRQQNSTNRASKHPRRIGDQAIPWWVAPGHCPPSLPSLPSLHLAVKF